MKIRLIAILSAITLLLSTISVQAKSPNNFVEKNSELAIKVAKEYELFPSVMMAQAIVESGFGKSLLASKYNNYFGMKGEGVIMDLASYQTFISVEDSFRGYARNFYSNSKIYSKFLSATNPIEAVKALNGIYSTNNSYSDQIIQIMDEYNLYELDNKVLELKKIEENNKKLINQYKENSVLQNKKLKEVAKKLINTVKTPKDEDAIFSLLPCLIKYSVEDISRLYNISIDEAKLLMYKYEHINRENLLFEKEKVDADNFNNFVLKSL